MRSLQFYYPVLELNSRNFHIQTRKSHRICVRIIWSFLKNWDSITYGSISLFIRAKILIDSSRQAWVWQISLKRFKALDFFSYQKYPIKQAAIKVKAQNMQISLWEFFIIETLKVTVKVTILLEIFEIITIKSQAWNCIWLFCFRFSLYMPNDGEMFDEMQCVSKRSTHIKSEGRKKYFSHEFNTSVF
jgi:hypothetical protein